MSTEKKWFALEITVNSEATEAIEFGLNELEALGTEINNLGKTPAETLTIIGYFNEKLDDNLLQNQLNTALQIYDFDQSVIKNLTWQEVENQDWLAEWKKTWKPTITDKFIIAPMWENVENTDKIVIRIEPSMAFGTGTHETTKLCLQAIEQHYKGESFFDVGTGTGILAIAAAKYRIQDLRFKIQDLGFKIQDSGFKIQNPQSETLNSESPIVGCDTDVDSIKIAKENAEVNDTSEIELYVGSIDNNTPEYEFVCANLTADVIIPILPLLVAKAKKILVLSGILGTQEAEVLAELKKLKIENCEVKADGEWISILIKMER